MIIATSLYLLTVAVLRAGWAAALVWVQRWLWASLCRIRWNARVLKSAQRVIVRRTVN